MASNDWLSYLPAWSGFITTAKSLAESNFITALVGSLAGAFGGAWAAQRIAERSKRRDELLREVRNANAAATMLYGIANSHLGLKEQHLQKLRDVFLEQGRDLELFKKAKAAGTVPPQQVFEFNADLQTLRPILSPTEHITKIIFNEMSAPSAVLFVTPILLATLQSLNESIELRNSLVDSWNANRPKNLAELYFGLRDGNMVDQRYSSAIHDIYNQTDDVIAFSTMIADAISEYAKTKRAAVERLGVKDILITKIDFSRFEKYIPPASNYSNFASMFDADKRKAGPPPWYRRWRASEQSKIMPSNGLPKSPS